MIELRISTLLKSIKQGLESGICLLWNWIQKPIEMYGKLNGEHLMEILASLNVQQVPYKNPLLH